MASVVEYNDAAAVGGTGRDRIAVCRGVSLGAVEGEIRAGEDGTRLVILMNLNLIGVGIDGIAVDLGDNVVLVGVGQLHGGVGVTGALSGGISVQNAGVGKGYIISGIEVGLVQIGLGESDVEGDVSARLCGVVDGVIGGGEGREGVALAVLQRDGNAVGVEGETFAHGIGDSVAVEAEVEGADSVDRADGRGLDLKVHGVADGNVGVVDVVLSGIVDSFDDGGVIFFGLGSKVDSVDAVDPAIGLGVVRQSKSGVGHALDVSGIVSRTNVVDTLRQIGEGFGSTVGIDLICTDDGRAGESSVLIQLVEDVGAVARGKVAVRDGGSDGGGADVGVVLHGIAGRGSRHEIGDLVDLELIAGFVTLDGEADRL